VPLESSPTISRRPERIPRRLVTSLRCTFP
jgi:hypothetical protein